MTLQHIDIKDLTVSPLNVRKYGAKDCADLVTSIRAIGLLQPLLVREMESGTQVEDSREGSGKDTDSARFEVIAGQRRLNALRILAEECGNTDPVPCMIMREGDDAAAIEASLAENIERLPMDEVDQFKAFTKLTKEGRTVEEIASTFGLTERLVSQRLALGNLHGPILTAYRKNDIHARDVRILTMASTKQQRAWWALVKDENAYVPTGQRLKDWLFGGAHIPTSNAIFCIESSGLAVVADLFGEESYFADAGAFWEHQSEAISQLAVCYRADDWADVIVMETGAHFATWEHRKTAKEDGGKVFIAVSRQGEVVEHEGYITSAEARRREAAATGEQKTETPELTKPAQNYVDLHRHAALRADLIGQHGVSLRLIAAHMIAGSSLWNVEPDPQRAAKPEIAESVETNAGQQALAKERAAVAALLGMEGDTVLPSRHGWEPRPSIVDVFARLTNMSDEDVQRVLTFAMIESLAVDSPLIDKLAQTMGTDIRKSWSPDDTFFSLIRDKQVLNAMIGEFAGETVAAGNVTATAKTQRTILTDCTNGTRTPSDPNWTPRYMAYPQGSYRGPLESAEAAQDAEQRLPETQEKQAA